MSLVNGQLYYYLTADEHTEIHNMYPELCHFFEGPDGRYYLAMGDLTDEDDFYWILTDLECLRTMEYSSSTQLGGGQ